MLLQELTASQIGINKWQWHFIEEENESEARAVMSKNRYDVLPVQSPNGQVKKFYSTRHWNNYTNLNLLDITPDLTTYYLITFKDLIKKFASEKHHFYFLSDYDNIVGLVSFVHINTHPVYNYLFHIISDIEQKIANLINTLASEERIITILKESNDPVNDNIIRKFSEAKEVGQDVDISQFLYLHNIGQILSELSSDITPEKKPILKYTKKFGAQSIYTIIRNKIVHPVRPILSDEKSIGELNELLSDYPHMLSILS